MSRIRRSVAAQIGGIGTFDIDQAICDRGAAEELYPPVVMTGDLDGCWYTDSFTGRSHPSGTYQETGTETFVGCLADGTTCGTFGTTIGSRPSSRRRVGDLRTLQHPIVSGSGTGGFEGVSGRVDFKDDVDAGLLRYRGYLKGVAGTTSTTTASATTGAVSSGC